MTGPDGFDEQRHERPDAPAPPSESGITSTPVALPERGVPTHRLRGREELIGKLTRAVREHVARPGHVPGVWVLSGLGGSGKTTAALEVAHQLSEEGPMARVWWVSADDAKGLSGALHAVAFDAGAGTGEFGRGHEADVLWRQLEKLREPWLLVLDNVNDPELLAAEKRPLHHGVGWLHPPRRLPGAVLVTSRWSGWPELADWTTELPVDVLDDEDGAQVLLDLAPEAGGRAEARLLAERLGGLPLALDLSGTFLKQAARGWPRVKGPRTFADYRRSLDERLGGRVADRASAPDELERDLTRITATWELSLDLLKEQENHAAEPLMLLLAAFGASPIPHQRLLDPEVITQSELFASCRPSRPELGRALTELTGHRFVHEESGGVGAEDDDTDGHLAIHPLVRLSMRFRREFTVGIRQLCDLVVALLRKALDGMDPAAPAHWPRWQDIAPHCAAPLDLLVPGMPESAVVEATDAALRAGLYRYYIGLYSDARRELQAVADVRREHLGADHPDTLVARLALALALRDEGRLHEAESEYDSLVRACEGTLPADHPHTQTARSGRARVLRELGRYAEAERELRVVLRIRKSAEPPDRRAVLRTRHDLATIWHKRDALSEAIAELGEIWETNRALFGDGDEISLACGISLARALRDAGRTEDAARVCSTVVTEIAKYRDPEHPDTLLVAHEFARIHRDQHHLTAAEAELKRIWILNRERYGDEHPDTVANRHELATVLHLLGRLQDAAQHFEAVLEINSRRFGDDHPNVRMCRDNLELVRADLAERAAEGTPREARVTEGAHTVAETLPEDAEPTAQDAAHSARAAAGPQADTGPDLAHLPLAEALAHAPSASDPANRRILERITRPRLSQGGNEPGGGGGYSTGSREPRRSAGRPGITYRIQGRRGQRETSEETPSVLPAPLRERNSFRALAMGTEDRDMVAELRAQQRGNRVRMLSALLEELRTQGGTVEPFGPVAHVRDLIHEAARVAPKTTDDLLMDPAVGRWFSRVLGVAGQRRTGGNLPLWAGRGHLYAIAAAAALRAGLSFTCRIPVHRGLAVLPTLGVADLGPTAAQVAVVGGAAGQATVRTAAAEVSLPGQFHNAAPGWYPLRRATGGGAGGPLTISLDDIHPFRRTGEPESPARLSEEHAARWADLIDEAGRILLRTSRRHAEASGVALTAITPSPAVEGALMASLSSSDAFGGAVLSEPQDAVELAGTLTHEFRHMKLNAVLDLVDLYDDRDDGALHYAPWRDVPRPFEGLFQGVYAFFGVAEYWQRLAVTAHGPELRRAQFELAYWRAQVWDTYLVLRDSSRWTDFGARFVALMGTSCGLWRRKHVPGDIAALAAEAVVDHRVRWRLHHLRPDPGEVAGLTDSRIHGAARPWRQRTGSVLCPDPAAQGLAVGMARIRRFAVDPNRARGGVPGQHSDVVDPAAPESADTVRLIGDITGARCLSVAEVTADPSRHDAWVSLALALRRMDSEVETRGAARALVHRPELVRAVYLSVRARAETAPDPVALAAWIDAPGAGDPPPVYRP
ncbi:aKG-HExxH-type peptide beta-hydroxylase [Streptomyces afghaniensis]|uniref:aKG-HExxH-type peptide beta-hydroxylase n=1 Tax=Streptomyces afghaniensis TaxID=66865 RepID=UPI003791693C